MSKIPSESRHNRKVAETPPEDIQLLHLKSKLNRIRNNEGVVVDKQTKSLINDITQQLNQNDAEDSGPYSLIFQLDATPSTTRDIVVGPIHKNEFQDHCQSLTQCPNLYTERLPNLINLDNKSIREYEYSCDAESDLSCKVGCTQSRNDLCLDLKTNAPFLTTTKQSPIDNSRNNEDNSYDDSLGILTPDQMDDICYLEHAFSPCDENILQNYPLNVAKSSPDSGDSPSTDKTETVSTVHNDIANNETKITVDQNMSNNLSKDFKRQTKENVFEGNSLHSVIDEFLPSVYSSVLELNSSIVEPQFLPKVNENVLHTQRIEQTPSPEELPLDSSEHNGETSTCSNSHYSASNIQDSQTYSESKGDFPKSMENSKVSISFVTSITSLDGYQGDGEMSRPVSRGGEHSICARAEIGEMEWQNVPVTRRADPMTDSDFFTESDADVLDDHMQKGDRRAQVIDGALYGGKNGAGNPLIVSRTEDSCMESSGVFTDLENHRSSPVYNSKCYNNESSQDSSPSNSETSQKQAVTEEPRPKREFPKEREGTRIIIKCKTASGEKSSEVKSKPAKEEKKNFLKKYKMPKRDVPSKLKSMLNSRKTESDNNQNSTKFNKKPERKDVISKRANTENINDIKNKYKDVKSKSETPIALQRSQTACGVNRMLSAKTAGNAKPKSRHLRMRLELGSADGSAKSSLHSSQSDISATCSTPAKTSLTRYPFLRNVKKRDSVQTPTTPSRAVATPPHPLPLNAKKNGIPKLASSPVSLRARSTVAPPPSPRKISTPRRVPPTRPNTLPTSNNKETTKLSAAAAAAVGPRNKRAQTPQSAVRSPPVPAIAPLVAQVVNNGQAKSLAHAAKGVEALGVLVQYLVFKLDALNGDSWKAEAERWRSVAAAERTSAARADQDRQQRAQKDLDTITECLNKISELEMEVSVKEEANARLQATHTQEIAALANDIRDLKETIESLKREVAESRSRLHAHSEIERTLRAQLEAARLQLKARLEDTDRPKETTEKCAMCDVACDPVTDELDLCQERLDCNEELSKDAGELAAEVRSLRAVVEMKQAELASLRGARSELAAERELRLAAERDVCAARHAAEELRERAAARQRDVDRLREDNRRLRDAANRDRDHAARVAALNEELRYKLRQKAQVVTLLAGNGYIERSSVRARTTSESSPPSPPSPRSPASPAPALPAVKGVVEKHDSVSWVLEIEETPEEVASRLARRSSFRSLSTSSSGGGGGGALKRRNGSSPGPGSPASPAPAPSAPNSPAPPAASKLFRGSDLDYPPHPLKESAGEAIYIYDDANY